MILFYSTTTGLHEDCPWTICTTLFLPSHDFEKKKKKMLETLKKNAVCVYEILSYLKWYLPSCLFPWCGSNNSRPIHNMYQMNYTGMGSAFPVCYEKQFSKMSNIVNFLFESVTLKILLPSKIVKGIPQLSLYWNTLLFFIFISTSYI